MLYGRAPRQKGFKKYKKDDRFLYYRIERKLTCFCFAIWSLARQEWCKRKHEYRKKPGVKQPWKRNKWKVTEDHNQTPKSEDLMTYYLNKILSQLVMQNKIYSFKSLQEITKS